VFYCTQNSTYRENYSKTWLPGYKMGKKWHVALDSHM